jgi:hypothetical protein
MPHLRSEVISGKYVVQYIFAAAATAAVEPLINSIGVGWTFTICEFELFVGLLIIQGLTQSQVSFLLSSAGFLFGSLRSGELTCKDGLKKDWARMKSQHDHQDALL